MTISAHQFPQVYEILGIDLTKLGCVMLELNPFWDADILDRSVLYYAKNKGRFWIKGWVFNAPHITLLYGLLSPAYVEPMHSLVQTVLEGWRLPTIFVDHVGYFDSPYPDEHYWCLVAHVRVTPDLLEGHQRLCLLPHVMTFPQYQPHATITYIDKACGEDYRDSLIKQMNDRWCGFSMLPNMLSYGSAK